MTSKNAYENDKPFFKKAKTKNSLTGGDPNHNPTHGNIFF